MSRALPILLKTLAVIAWAHEMAKRRASNPERKDTAESVDPLAENPVFALLSAPLFQKQDSINEVRGSLFPQPRAARCAAGSVR